MLIRRKEIIIVPIFILIVLIIVLNIQEQTQEQEKVNETLISTQTFLNVSRKFHMGLTPFPYDITTEAVQNTYNFLSQHTDIIAHHFDSGIPWPEAYNQEKYHQQVEQNIKTRLEHKTENQNIYLALTPINGIRNNIAGYWAEKENMPQNSEWQTTSFKDQKTVTAYINFCEYMIERFQPKYMAYGIEVNMLAETNPEIWSDYVKFTEQVYYDLKKNHPDLPIFLTFQIDYYYGNPDSQKQAVKELLPYTDILAVSTYPFTRYPDPSLIPSNHFSEFAALSVSKPFAVAETGFPSDSIIINKGLSVTGTPEWQNEYLKFLLKNCQSLEAEFMIWFCPADYDKTWDYLIDYGVDPIYKLWIDTGLLDEELHEKPVFKSWDLWLFDKKNTIKKAMSIDELVEISNYPKIASWLAKKDELIEAEKPFSLVMSGWFTPEEAAKLREYNPEVKILAGLTTTWVWGNEEWKQFLLDVASYGRSEVFELSEDMFLHTEDGKRCVFGWESEEWQHEEIYAMDPRNPKWVELIVSFYGNVLTQPQHDGIIVDMVMEKQYFSDAISDEEWLESTKTIYRKIDELNIDEKLVIFNSGARLSDIDEYSMFFDGFLMENFMGEQLETTFSEGLAAGESGFIVIYGVDTDNTGVIDYNKMRLGLVLSILFDETYFAYDFGPRDHGQAWWFKEYEVVLGEPIGDYYEVDGAFWRKFEHGFIVAAPNGASLSFDCPYEDVSSGLISYEFTIDAGDGRIYLNHNEN